MPPAPAIVDAHVHCFFEGYFPRAWFEAKARQWAGRRHPARDPAEIVDDIEPRITDPDGALLRADLAGAGIDQAVCIGVDPGLAFTPERPSDIRTHIERQAEIVDRVDGLHGFVGVDPRRPGAGELVRWALGDLGFRGVKVYAPHGYLPADPRCEPIYHACLAAGAPVMFHTAEAAYPLLTRFANPLYVQDVQLAFPDLTIVLGHAGYPLWLEEATLVARGHPRTFLEVSNWDRMLDRDPDRVVAALRHMRDEVGAHRMLFGSDHFAGPGRSRQRERLGRWVELARTTTVFDDAERRLFLGGNAARLLGLDGI